jgi:hypothetical protein
LNEEALESSQLAEDAQSLDELLEDGRLDELERALDAMIAESDELGQALSDAESSYGDDEYREVRERAQRLADDLSSLKRAEEDLVRKDARLLGSLEKQVLDKMEHGALDEAIKKAGAAERALSGIEERALLLFEQENAAMAAARASDLVRALVGNDITDAQAAVSEALQASRALDRSLEERLRGQAGDNALPGKRAHQAAVDARALLEEVLRMLAELMPDLARMMSKGERADVEQSSALQGKLAERASRLAAEMQEIGESAPVFGPSHQQQIGRAAAEMREAAVELSRLDVRQARGSQREAVALLDELMQAMNEAAEKAGGRRGGLPMPLARGGDGLSRGGRGGAAHERVEIPDADAFQVPGAFRRDILDAMRESVPERWAPAVKRYYEEIVR